MPEDPRTTLLLKMYDQMFNDIDRHILVVWQSVGTLVGAFAIMALTWKGVLSLDVSSSLILAICGWLFAHTLDAAYWYNRNLVIIANIERQFLNRSDLKEIHYYWGKHRPKNKMITHLRIQFFLGIGIALIIGIHHFSVRVSPGFSAPFENFQLERSLPYIVALVATILVWKLRRMRQDSYEEFLKNSPGRDIDTLGTEYGVGHGHDKTNQSTPTS